MEFRIPQSPPPAALAPRHARLGLRLVPLSSGLHRVVTADGSVLGYLQSVEILGHGTRIASRRMVGAGRRFTELGDFATRDDAVDALRFG